MKNKGSDEDCFRDCRIWDQQNLLEMELMVTERDSQEGSAHTPICNPQVAKGAQHVFLKGLIWSLRIEIID